MTQMSAAENKFFESRGTEVDASLTAGNDSTPSEPSPVAAPPSAPAPASSTQSASTPDGTPAAAPPVAQPAAQPPQGQQPDSRQVPIEALHAERRQRQQMEQQFQQLQRQFTEMQQFLQQAAQPQDERPDEQADPMGALAWDNRQLRAQMEQMNQRFGQEEQRQQQRQQAQRLTQHLTSSERQFAQTQPDYFQAADFAIRREDLRLSAFYPDPAVRQQIMRQEIANVVANAIQSGVNPAQLIYQHALNLGYTRAAAPGVPTGPAIAGGGAPAGAPVAPAALPPTVPEAVATIQRGLQQQTRSGSGGSTPPSELTPEMLLAMNGEEFNKNWNKAFGKR